ncbi:MAG: TetR/AcrR family transcriptional regulator [Chitinophagales bacterium]|nr:TetR/AcrR family transcriptional regulator [Chitinophagales bacterium]
MQATNKEKIIIAALKLFNENGLVNVRLQHISDEAIVSVGNMAYHYTNKEAIVMALYQDLTKKQKALLAEYRIVPLFDNIDRLIRHTYHLQQEYVFFYLDTLEIVRAYPAVGAAHQQHIRFQIEQLQFMLDFNEKRGALLPATFEGVFQKLAKQIWMTMSFWRSQQAVRYEEEPSEESYKDAVWNLLIPHFTEMGKREYTQMLEQPYDFYF